MGFGVVEIWPCGEFCAATLGGAMVLTRCLTVSTTINEKAGEIPGPVEMY